MRGIGRYPAIEGEPYPLYVAAVDAEGNEVAGIALPDLTVPLGTHSGGNPRDPQLGGAGQLVPLQGSSLPFARTAVGRSARHDPRPALAERYRDRADYLARVRDAAEALVARRLLLAEDVALAVTLAARYDLIAGA